MLAVRPGDGGRDRRADAVAAAADQHVLGKALPVSFARRVLMADTVDLIVVGEALRAEQLARSEYLPTSLSYPAAPYRRQGLIGNISEARVYSNALSDADLLATWQAMGAAA